jgi:Flp pilus assembly protein TadG
MTMTTIIGGLRASLRAFRRTERGNVAVTFTLALIPIMGFVGAAVDYSRANSAKASMQSAADATALMLSKEVTTLTTTQTIQKATDYFNALFHRPDVTGVVVSPTFTNSNGTELVVTASTNFPTIFMKAMGQQSVAINVSSTVSWGSTKLRVALVLDTTGSMASAGKIAALQSSTKNLLTQLQTAAVNNGDVYVSIVPFSKNVNVGSSNYNGIWLDWTDWEAEPAILKASKPSNWSSTGPGSSCPFSSSSHGFSCTTGPVNGSSTTSTIPSSGAYSGYICPDVDGGNKDSTKIGIYYNGCYDSVATTTTSTNTVSSGSQASCSGHSNCTCTGNGSNKVCSQTVTTTGAPYTHNWIKNARNTWNGCITDRGTSSAPNSDYDRMVTTTSTGIPASLFPAEQNSYCSPEVMGLNYSWSTMKTMVDNLYPLGATNQPIGLVWGWQSLVGGGPLTMPAKSSNYTYNEVIVLMSDGLNTLDRWYGNGSSTNTSVDKRMYESSTLGTCVNIKAAGITIYTVHVNTDGSPMSTLLQNCASSPDKFWMVTSASALGTVFNQIGTKLSTLRIAK